jgi:uncharacterized glyoxalase superfamily protein PhnB
MIVVSILGPGVSVDGIYACDNGEGRMGSTVVPCLRYGDARRMADWLGEVFGFEPRAVYDDGQGGVAHAQLTLGAGMIMLGSARDDAFGRAQSQPAVLKGTTQSAYVVVADADEVYRRAKAAGAEIVIEIKDEDYGGRGFSCRDPEGHLWNVGSYDPWRATS